MSGVEFCLYMKNVFGRVLFIKYVKRVLVKLVLFRSVCKILLVFLFFENGKIIFNVLLFLWKKNFYILNFYYSKKKCVFVCILLGVFFI